MRIGNAEAIYRTLHNCDPAYRNNNQGSLLIGDWIHVLEPGSKVVEIGCGNGLLCEFLSRAGFDVRGTDIVTGPYERKGYTFYKQDITCFPWTCSKDQFDAVLCFDVLEHLDEESALRVLSEMTRIGRTVVFSVASYGKPPLHLTVKTPGWWLNKTLDICPEFDWQVLRVVERKTEKREGLIATLFYGTRKEIGT